MTVSSSSFSCGISPFARPSVDRVSLTNVHIILIFFLFVLISHCYCQSHQLQSSLFPVVSMEIASHLVGLLSLKIWFLGPVYNRSSIINSE
jgi:hypothetical protein